MKELKDFLTPPFAYKCNSHGDWGIFNGAVGMFFFNQYLEEICGIPKEELLKFATQALNNEWQRQFGGVWACRCPNCFKDADDFFNYCPSCGERLRPPEGT